jgi:hypothetical protein
VTEFVELVSVVGYLSNIYEYVTVLGMMQEGWNQDTSRLLHGGLVQYVFQHIIGLVGCVTGGSGRQMQTFINKDFVMKDVCSNCLEIKNTIRKLVSDRNKDYHEHTHSAMRKSADILLSGLTERCKFMGTMTVTHIVHSLCLIQLAPVHLLNFAIMSPNANQFKKKNLSGALREFLATDEDTECTKKTERNSVLLASLTRYLRVTCECPHLSQATAENILCEATRKSETYDLFYAGHWFHREVPANINMEKSKGHTDWVAVFPIIDTSGELSYKCDKRIDPMELFVDETKTNTSGQQSLAIWGTEKEAMPDLVLPIGGKRMTVLTGKVTLMLSL